jgi:hypothetical protein
MLRTLLRYTESFGQMLNRLHLDDIHQMGAIMHTAHPEFSTETPELSRDVFQTYWDNGVWALHYESVAMYQLDEIDGPEVALLPMIDPGTTFDAAIVYEEGGEIVFIDARQQGDNILCRVQGPIDTHAAVQLLRNLWCDPNRELFFVVHRSDND